jgi:hypothetical protein
MPPRFAYWTILIDGRPTAFRARDQQELLPTFHQLKRTSEDVVFRWFARGRLWESQRQEREARRQPKAPAEVRRARDWRPGGQHEDPRARFAKKPGAHHRDRGRPAGVRGADVKRPSGTPHGAPGRRRFGKRRSEDKDKE